MGLFEVVEGTTAPLDFSVLENGAPPDLTGMTITLILKDSAGAIVGVAGTVASPGIGVIRYTPNASDLVAASTPHTARFKVTSGASVKFYPGGGAHGGAADAMTWRVKAQ
jgi:hypothetical protein